MPVLQNARHEQVAQLIAIGLTKTEAYAEVYKCDEVSARANIHKWIAKDSVRERIMEVQEEIADGRILTARERRLYLADLVRCKPSEITRDSPLCNGIKYDKEGREILEIPDKLAALKLDAQLAGDLKEGGSTVNVQILSLKMDGGEN